MKCCNPVLRIKLGNNTIFRHWQHASYIQKTTGIPFDCGSCIFCRKKKSLELARRCVLHASTYTHNCFITLTYNESSVGDNSITYSDIQKFKKRLRKSLNGKKIEIFNVHEYGKKGRKHWHLVIFGHDFEDKTLFSENAGIPIYTSKKLLKLWPYGHNTIGSVTEASALYQAQYTQKDIKNGNTNNEKKAKSNHSGIGKKYFLTHWKQILTLGYIPFGTQKMPVPRYFERLAHKHFCHYYDQSAFFDNNERKAIHRPFKNGEQNLELANLYIKYIEQKQLRIKEMQTEWEETLNQHFNTKLDPDFVVSGQNYLHDLNNKNLVSKEDF